MSARIGNVVFAMTITVAGAFAISSSVAFAQYGFGKPLEDPFDVAVEASGDLVVVARGDDGYGVFRVDPATGDRTVVSDDETGVGTPLDWTVGIAVEPSGDLVVVSPFENAVVRVDPVSGDRSVVSDSVTGTGPMISSPYGIAVEASGDLVVFDYTSSAGGAVLRVDPVTGDRAVVSDDTTGAGPTLHPGFAIAVEDSGDIVVADWLGTVLRIDPMTGDRVVLSDGGTGSGPSLSSADGIALEGSGTLVVSDRDSDALIRIDPVTGDRTVISDGSMGSGPLFEVPFQVAVEASGALIVTDNPSFDSGDDPGALYRVDSVSGDRAILSRWACPDVPSSSCNVPGKSTLVLKDNRSSSVKDKLVWKFINGPAEAQSAFGDPTSTAVYEICVYSGGSLYLRAGVAAGGTCEERPCWKEVGGKGYKFKDRTMMQDGVSKVLLKGNEDEPRTKILVKGKGANLPIEPSTLPLPDSTVAVRLINSDNANCWGADFPTGSVVKNTNSLFKAKTP